MNIKVTKLIACIGIAFSSTHMNCSSDQPAQTAGLASIAAAPSVANPTEPTKEDSRCWLAEDRASNNGKAVQVWRPVGWKPLNPLTYKEDKNIKCGGHELTEQEYFDLYTQLAFEYDHPGKNINQMYPKKPSEEKSPKTSVAAALIASQNTAKPSSPKAAKANL